MRTCDLIEQITISVHAPPKNIQIVHGRAVQSGVHSRQRAVESGATIVIGFAVTDLMSASCTLLAAELTSHASAARRGGHPLSPLQKKEREKRVRPRSLEAFL